MCLSLHLSLALYHALAKLLIPWRLFHLILLTAFYCNGRLRVLGTSACHGNVSTLHTSVCQVNNHRQTGRDGNDLKCLSVCLFLTQSLIHSLSHSIYVMCCSPLGLVYEENVGHSCLFLAFLYNSIASSICLPFDFVSCSYMRVDSFDLCSHAHI